MLRLFGPLEQAAHGIEKVARLRWRLGAAILASDNRRLSDIAIRFIAGRFQNAPEMVFVIASRGKRKISPSRRLAIALDQPSEAADGGGVLCARDSS
jgi:hypothetical protein